MNSIDCRTVHLCVRKKNGTSWGEFQLTVRFSLRVRRRRIEYDMSFKTFIPSRIGNIVLLLAGIQNSTDYFYYFHVRKEGPLTFNHQGVFRARRYEQYRVTPNVSRTQLPLYAW